MKSFEVNLASIIREAGTGPLAFSAFIAFLISIVGVYFFGQELFWVRIVIFIVIFLFVSSFALFVLKKFGTSGNSSTHDHALDNPSVERNDSQEKEVGKKTVYCSFCGKSQNEVSKLIAGPTVFICDECTDICFDITTEISGKAETLNTICELTLEASNPNLEMHHRQEIMEKVRDIADSVRHRRRESSGDIRAGCRLHRVIGAGNFGTVWQAYRLLDSKTEEGSPSNDKKNQINNEVKETLAIKKFDEDKITVGLMLWRFLRGIRAMEHFSNVLLNPPESIIRLVYVDLDNICFSMQYLPNGDLENIGNYGWSIHKKLDIFLQICEAVDFAHSHNVVHRDIKPANIVLDERYNAVLTDFDIADLRFARTQSVYAGSLGTPQFAAPEQLIGDNLVAYPTADIYSLGKLLFFLFREVAPPLGSTDGDSVPGYIGEIESVAIREIIAGAIQYNPDKRYPMVSDLLSDLERTIEVERGTLK